MRETREMNIYDDIIERPHHKSATRIPMPVSERAAQFSAFAALTGHGEAVREAGRLTDDRIELDESSRELLDEKLSVLIQHIADRPVLSIQYFVPDAYKNGGEYKEITGPVKRVDIYGKVIIMENETSISMNDIINMDGDIF
ncbi:MAG: YolD-like family protein [Lachnospiraceae bacterium]|nr:YolD-like family protein [Lachnospiraceae bacterium]